MEHQEATKEAKANMSLFTTTVSEGKKAKKGTEKTSKEASGKNRSDKEKASHETKEGMAPPSNSTAPEICKGYKAIYKEAILAKETAKSQKDAAATKMFQFYANLLSLDAKCAWNKIVKEQMEADQFRDLKGVSRKGPRGLLQESFNDCVMLHLLTVFPQNAAEQEKYYLSNMLKKLGWEIHLEFRGIPQLIQFRTF